MGYRLEGRWLRCPSWGLRESRNRHKTPDVGCDPLLRKCEELLELLYANGEHAKLRRLVADIEALRDRLLLERATDADRPTGAETGQTPGAAIERSDAT